jgi:hypothetical protein
VLVGHLMLGLYVCLRILIVGVVHSFTCSRHISVISLISVSIACVVLGELMLVTLINTDPHTFVGLGS